MPYYVVYPENKIAEHSDVHGGARPREEDCNAVFVPFRGDATVRTFMESMSAARLLLRVGVDCLQDVPKSLPPTIKDKYIASLKASQGRSMVWTEIEDGGFVADASLTELEEHGVTNDIALIANFYGDRKNNGPLQRQSVATSQFVIVAFSLLDAFILDTLRTVSIEHPRTLKSGKTITWEAVVDAGTFESVIEHIVESHLFEIGMLPLQKKLEKIAKHYGVDLAIDEDEMKNLLKAEQARHLFTHTGGVVSARFLEFVKDADYNLGDLLTVDLTYCFNLSNAISSLAFKLFDEMAKKYGIVESKDVSRSQDQ